MNTKFYSIALNLTVLLFLILSLRHQYFLLNYREFGDESETIVAAGMMAAGLRLYSEIFNHHGPLIFLPGVIVEHLGDFGVIGHRVFVAILQILAVLLIYKSPVFEFLTQRVLAAVISATIILSFMPDIFGHMYKYQTVAGIFLMIILSQYTIPSILCPKKLRGWQIVLGVSLLSSLPFLAVSYLPISILLLISSCRPEFIKAAAAGLALGLTTNLLFLSVYGSFFGYFAFHIYLNLEILPLYNNSPVGAGLIIRALHTATSDLAHFLTLALLLLAAILTAQREPQFPWRTFLLIAGLLSLLIRGSGFHGMPFLYSAIPFLLLSLTFIDERNLGVRFVSLGFIALCLLKVSLLLPGDRERITSSQIQLETDFSRLTSSFTKPEDRIIAYSFQNFQYIAANRLPASGHFFYLPWQEKYNEDPRLGIMIDACDDIMRATPKVMLIDQWTVWGNFPWDAYGGCVQDYADANYYQIPETPYYIRRDLLSNFYDYLHEMGQQLTPSLALTPGGSINLSFHESLLRTAGSRRIVAIDIMFGTYARANAGGAILELETETNERIGVEFQLSELLDNRYARFEIPEGTYVAGKIHWSTGGGVSVWEIGNETEAGHSCIKLLFSDGSWGITPGCPLY